MSTLPTPSGGAVPSRQELRAAFADGVRALGPTTIAIAVWGW